MPGATPQTNVSNISRRELAWLAGSILFGSILRLSFPDRMAIEHFDEGVYASNFWFGAEMGYEYPARHLYAPPLLPAVIEWTMIVASLLGVKPTGWIPMIPSLIAGIATIPSIWWIGRRWFGPSAGLTAAWLVATSDLHASYSRAALTDVPVTLFILWAVYFFWQALIVRDRKTPSSNGHRPNSVSTNDPGLDWWNCVLAGIFTGLAWCTKYTGWLPLAIGLAGGALWQLLLPVSQRQLRRSLISWLLAAGIAGLFWSFVLWNLNDQNRGGYASVVANHRQYLVGLSGWLRSALIQARHLGVYENWFGWIAEFGDPTAVGSISITAWLMLPMFQFLAGRAILLGLWRFNRGPERLAVCLLAAWYCGMTVSTPFYYPYPRLVFPWLTAIWLCLALGLELLSRRSQASEPEPQTDFNRKTIHSLWVGCLVVLLTVNSGIRSLNGTAHAWQDRTRLAGISRIISGRIRHVNNIRGPAIDQAIVYVWGEPALVFGLRACGVSNVMPVAGLGFVGEHQPVPTYIVFGKQAYDGQSFPEQRRVLERCQSLAQYQIHPSHLVMMDSADWDAYEEYADAVDLIKLYRVP